MIQLDPFLADTCYHGRTTQTQAYTRNIGARTKVMGRRNHCLHKQNVSLAYKLDNGKITVEFRGDPLFKNARKYINKKEMVKFRVVSKNDMTYLETAV